MANPNIQLGNLNRVRASVVVPAFSALNIISSYMTDRFVSISFDEDFVGQIQTATGIVNSPEPYVMASVTTQVLRTLPIAGSYISQAQSNAILGTVVIHSDSTSFPAIRIRNASLLRPQPGEYSGKSGALDITLRGVYEVNNDLWNL